ncbi:MAG: MBL fold metallo-hydrolase [Bacteroidales bacterium]|nr:MBL fold metallo-hydrolase [Bacteroidales bacterium]
MELQFLSLASGSSGNCYFLGNSEYGILIDAGIGIKTIKKTLKDNNIPFENIIALFVTHDHADHIKSAGIIGEKLFIPVYSTEDIHSGMNKNYSMTEKIYASKRIIRKNEVIEIRDLKITPFEVPHDGTDNVGYSIEYKGRKFVFATDLGHIPHDVATYLAEADFMVLEANYDHEMLKNGRYSQFLKDRVSSSHGHMDNHDTAEYIANNYVEKLQYIFLCHLSQHNNHPELAFKTVEYKLAEKNIKIGKDVQLVVLKRTTASELYTL